MYFLIVKKRASFLILSLWMFILLAIITAGLAFRCKAEVQRTKLIIARSRALSLAETGITLAKQILRDDDQSVDYLTESWAQTHKRIVTYENLCNQGILEINIVDESRKINLNYLCKKIIDQQSGSLNSPELKLLCKIFDDAKIDNYPEKIDRLLDYIDSDSNSRRFLSDDIGVVKNNYPVILEELTIPCRLTETDFAFVQKYFTLNDSTKLNVNINTCGKNIRELLIDSLLDKDIDVKNSLKAETAKILAGNDGIEGSQDDGWYSSAQPIPQELQNIFSFFSSVFYIKSRSQAGEIVKEINCIFDRGKDKIIYWSES